MDEFLNLTRSGAVKAAFCNRIMVEVFDVTTTKCSLISRIHSCICPSSLFVVLCLV